MSEPEKKGSTWPWILVPVAAFSLFFVLRQCRQSLPPSEHAPAPSVSAHPQPAEPETAPAPAPAPP